MSMSAAGEGVLRLCIVHGGAVLTEWAPTSAERGGLTTSAPSLSRSPVGGSDAQQPVAIGARRPDAGSDGAPQEVRIMDRKDALE
jgi:hypothetical protein